jgi:hypothetical protein
MKRREVMSIAAITAAAVACGSGSSTGGLDVQTTYTFALTSGAEVPAPKPTTASGTAQLIVYPTSIDYKVSATSITGITASHIHSGAPGVAGPIVVTLYQATNPLTSANGVFASGTITQSMPGSSITIDALKTLLASGNAYVDVHTTANPNGEIRGQVQ